MYKSQLTSLKQSHATEVSTAEHRHQDHVKSMTTESKRLQMSVKQLSEDNRGMRVQIKDLNAQLTNRDSVVGELQKSVKQLQMRNEQLRSAVGLQKSLSKPPAERVVTKIKTVYIPAAVDSRPVQVDKQLQTLSPSCKNSHCQTVFAKSQSSDEYAPYLKRLLDVHIDGLRIFAEYASILAGSDEGEVHQLSSLPGLPVHDVVDVIDGFRSTHIDTICRNLPKSLEYYITSSSAEQSSAAGLEVFLESVLGVVRYCTAANYKVLHRHRHELTQTFSVLLRTSSSSATTTTITLTKPSCKLLCLLIMLQIIEGVARTRPMTEDGNEEDGNGNEDESEDGNDVSFPLMISERHVPQPDDECVRALEMYDGTTSIRKHLQNTLLTPCVRSKLRHLLNLD